MLPGKVGETLTVNGVEQELTGKQQKALQEAYNASEAALGSLFRSSGYAALDDAGKARAARYLQDYFTALGKSTVLGIAVPSKYYLYELLGADVAALHLSVIAGIEADKDKAGNTVANSRKSKVHDYIESQRLTRLAEVHSADPCRVQAGRSGQRSGAPRHQPALRLPGHQGRSPGTRGLTKNNL